MVSKSYLKVEYIVNQNQTQSERPQIRRTNSSQNGHIDLNNTNNIIQHINSNSHEQENSSSNQNLFYFSQSLNNRLVSFENNINENELIPNNLSNNDYNEFFFNSNFDAKLTQAHNNIITLLNNERKKISDSQEFVEKLRQDYIKYKKIELEKLNKEKNELKYLYKLYNNAKETDILELNIGGTHEITTTRGTLIKYKNSALAVFFSGLYPLPMLGDKVFIDREGEQFVNLVNFLRNEKFPIFKDKEEEDKFKEELDFWKITIQDKSKLYIINYYRNI